nr:hypothetical protein PJ912_06610 [Pectobacterium colocasium]
MRAPVGQRLVSEGKRQPALLFTLFAGAGIGGGKAQPVLGQVRARQMVGQHRVANHRERALVVVACQQRISGPPRRGIHASTSTTGQTACRRAAQWQRRCRGTGAGAASATRRRGLQGKASSGSLCGVYGRGGKRL